MMLPRVGAVEVTIETETTSTDSVGQEWLPSTSSAVAGLYLIACHLQASLRKLLTDGVLRST